jgi:hypothetical protein
MDESDELPPEVIPVPLPDPEPAAAPVLPPPSAGFLTDRRIEIEVDGDGEPRLRIIEGLTGRS